MSEIINNYKKIINQIENYKKEFSRTARNPELIAVSKTFSSDKIQIIIDEGQRIFGENKVQEAQKKWTKLKSTNKGIELHLLGPLQSNKIKPALEIFDVIQTIDREKVVVKIKKHLDLNVTEKKHKFFIQVNTGNEEQKSGVKINEVEEFLEWCTKKINLNINGLMCIPPVNEEPSIHFNILRELCDRLGLVHSSMGMTIDFKAAIQFGATYLRIGSGIFGPRS